jgi:hypothetical protein
LYVSELTWGNVEQMAVDVRSLREESFRLFGEALLPLSSAFPLPCPFPFSLAHRTQSTMVTPPKPPSDARAQISQSTVVIPKALLASLPPPTTAEMMFDLEEVDKDGGFGLPEFEEGYIFRKYR